MVTMPPKKRTNLASFIAQRTLKNFKYLLLRGDSKFKRKKTGDSRINANCRSTALGPVFEKGFFL